MTDATTARVGRKVSTRATSFARGLGAPLRGLRFVFREQPRVLLRWLPVVGAVPIFALGSLAVGLELGPAITDALGLGHSSHHGAWWRAMLDGAADVALGLGLAAVLFVALMSATTAVFADALSEAVEERITGIAPPDFSISRALRDAWRALRIESSRLALYVAVVVPSFVVSLVVPVVGPAVHAVLAFALTALFLAVAYVDWPASRRGWGIRRRVAWCRAHAAEVLGLGTAVWACLWVPCVGLLLMPGAIAGGTLLFLDLEREDGAPPA